MQAYFRWNDPDALAQAYIADVRECSYGYAGYTIVERLTVDAFPRKADGFQYGGASYLAARQSGAFHQPDLADYEALVRELGILERVRSGAADEIWLFGFPFGGYYESIMGGPGAFWCNAPPLAGTGAAARRFVIMGFSYERGVGEMLEDLGHRAESILGRVFSRTRGEANLWERFTRYDRSHPGRAECGTVHFAPNSTSDYDWGNRRRVPSRCDNWYRFRDLAGEPIGDPRMVDCREWGNGDIRLHHRWWLRHFPHFAGASRSIAWNWWQYVIDPNTAPG